MAVVRDRLTIDPQSPELRALVSGAARAAGVRESMLRLRALLNLPRLADASGHADADEAQRETERIACRLRELTAPVEEWLKAPISPPKHPSQLRLAPVQEELARAVNERLHYLGSHRPDARNVGAWYEDRFVGLLSFASLDVRTIVDALPTGLDPRCVQVLARVFALDWAPANWLSNVLARAQRELKREGVTVLMTYVNPNMGFTAASYRSANWFQFAHEHGTRYGYLDGDYVTDRQLVRQYGTADPATLVAVLGERIQFSRMPLRPLDLYAQALGRRWDSLLRADDVHELLRP